jgi:hypothetical protein
MHASENDFEAIGIGTAVGCCIGLAVGGVVGTVDFPIAGTLFGAVYGLAFGALTGMADGLVLLALARRVGSRPAARWVSALVWLLGAVAAIEQDGPFTLPHDGAGRVALAVLGLLCGATVAPLISPTSDPRLVTRRAQVAAIVARLLLWGAIGGAAVGALVGLVIGLRSYLPTAPVAAVECAILGSTSAAVLALLLAGIAVLPRLWRQP